MSASSRTGQLVGKTAQRWDPLSLSNLLSPRLNPFVPAQAAESAPLQGTQPSGGTSAQTTPSAAGPALPAGGTVTTPPGKTAAPATPPPLISFTPLAADGSATGPTITIHNPLRDLLNIDINSPILPQLLPPPIVQILTAMSKQIPLTDLVLTPLSDYILPALMSDIVIPMGSFNGTTPAPQGVHATELRGPAMWSLPASGPPPAEIALGGVDMPQAPAPSPPPLPSQGPSDRGPQPIPAAPPPPKDATPLSEPVAYRAGYSEYLRNAGMAQITSVALPGIAGILLVTIGGGFIGYRQARAGHVIRAKGSARFLR